ncbi:hypothetical protein E3_1900 [Rhodococcus phage E3]|uniref:hypothetical protein n=1 Tax=Rhodococcus phage E3 TaxID=1007869 RepID=UPI0002C69BD1|nr:hypothetical protein M176_gp202 [Rhodococcus phage E3]AEQ21110.1 hypothetical protein E3_1900 [Rhodococcus phage E3]
MTVAIDADECVCGDCRDCHRAMFGETRPVAPVVLSEAARAILAEPPRPPQARPRPAAVVQPNEPAMKPCSEADCSTKTRHESGLCAAHRPAPPASVNPEDLVPVPCTECGEMRIVIKWGRTWALAGEDGLCELCFDRRKNAEKLRQSIAGIKVLSPAQLTRIRRMSERVMRDGRPFHPHAHKHGTAGIFSNWGCRCSTCRDGKRDYRLEKAREQ